MDQTDRAVSRFSPFNLCLRAAESGFVPDGIIRAAIRRLLRTRLRELLAGSADEIRVRQQRFLSVSNSSPIAPVPDLANRQHYEVPAEFFRLVLGKRLKYSCCLWDGAAATLDEAEEQALHETCHRAEIEDGMKILDLGCGWGSVALWIAEHYPRCEITAVSNSLAQGEFIRSRAEELGAENLTVITADMNTFAPPGQFDRVVSVEMFEHMRNHRELLKRVATWLTPGGRLFVHVFCHRNSAYAFESNGPQDWMAEHFFTGGMMPSESLFGEFDDDLRVVRQWTWSGHDYARTSNAWLDRLDAQRDAVHRIFDDCYGASESRIWLQRWRIFFMSCAELFAFHDGGEWYVSHTLFAHQTNTPEPTVSSLPVTPS